MARWAVESCTSVDCGDEVQFDNGVVDAGVVVGDDGVAHIRATLIESPLSTFGRNHSRQRTPNAACDLSRRLTLKKLHHSTGRNVWVTDNFCRALYVSGTKKTSS